MTARTLFELGALTALVAMALGALWQCPTDFDRLHTFHALRHATITNVYRASKDLFLAQRFVSVPHRQTVEARLSRDSDGGPNEELPPPEGEGGSDRVQQEDGSPSFARIELSAWLRGVGVRCASKT